MGANLISRAEYKAYAGITSTTQDQLIDIVIPIASQLVKSLCRRTFVDYVDEAKTEYFDGGDAFDLSEYPVLSIQSVEYSSDNGQTYSTLTEFTDYYYHNREEVIKPVATSYFPYKNNGYKVTYTAGYEELPKDLKVAVLDLVKYYLSNDAVVKSAKGPGSNTVQIEYITNTKLPTHISRVLDLYQANYL